MQLVITVLVFLPRATGSTFISAQWILSLFAISILRWRDKTDDHGLDSALVSLADHIFDRFNYAMNRQATLEQVILIKISCAINCNQGQPWYGCQGCHRDCHSSLRQIRRTTTWTCKYGDGNTTDAQWTCICAYCTCVFKCIYSTHDEYQFFQIDLACECPLIMAN